RRAHCVVPGRSLEAYASQEIGLGSPSVEGSMKVEDIRSELERRGITRVKVGGFDIDGILRGKYMELPKFWSSLEKGFGFCDVVFGWDASDVLYDNAAVTGWATGYPDAIAKIDLSTFRVL